MSIIGDALKKAQTERSGKNKKSVITEALKKLQSIQTAKDKLSSATEALKRLQGEHLDQAAAGGVEDKDRILGSASIKSWSLVKSPQFIIIFSAAIFACLVVIGIIFMRQAQLSREGVSFSSSREKMTSLPSEMIVPEKKEFPPAVSPTTPGYQEESIRLVENTSGKTVEETSFVWQSLPVVKGIMYSTSSPQAVINGKMVSEGDTVNGFKVEKISPDIVTVSFDDKEFELKLR